jgi:methionyl-tRNA formyltransferase
VHHAVWAGDEETGVCLMEMVEKMDAGKIYAVEKVPIGPDDTTYDLNQKLMPASAKLIREKLPEYLAGNLPGTEQDERFYTIARNISKDQEHVRFGRVNVHEAYNHVRALIDWPIPYGVIEGKRIRIYKARMQEGLPEGIIPGTLIGFREGAMEIACLDGIVKVYELQPEGKSRMNADAFANGRLIGKKEGFLVGISAGAALTAALQLAREPGNEGKNIVAIFADTGERYLSTALFED